MQMLVLGEVLEALAILSYTHSVSDFVPCTGDEVLESGGGLALAKFYQDKGCIS